VVPHQACHPRGCVSAILGPLRQVRRRRARFAVDAVTLYALLALEELLAAAGVPRDNAGCQGPPCNQRSRDRRSNPQRGWSPRGLFSARKPRKGKDFLESVILPLSTSPGPGGTCSSVCPRFRRHDFRYCPDADHSSTVWGLLVFKAKISRARTGNWGPHRAMGAREVSWCSPSARQGCQHQAEEQGFHSGNRTPDLRFLRDDGLPPTPHGRPQPTRFVPRCYSRFQNNRPN
jgi:hypothetical protein